jgi:hypothetical protein
MPKILIFIISRQPMDITIAHGYHDSPWISRQPMDITVHDTAHELGTYAGIQKQTYLNVLIVSSKL